MDNKNIFRNEQKQENKDFFVKKEGNKEVLDVNPAGYSAEKMTLDRTRTSSWLSSEKTRLSGSLEEGNLRANKTLYHDKVAMTEEYLAINGNILMRDWRLFRHASPEMTYVRNMVAGLINFMDEELKLDNGRIDVQALKADGGKAYSFALKACNHYIAKRNPGSIPGKRRLRMVKNIRKLIVEEQRRFNQVVSRLMEINKVNVEDENLADEETVEEKKRMMAAKTPGQLIRTIRSKRIEGNAVWQKEGNSTDVYRLKLQGKDGKYYYFKENLPPISKDFEGFLKRRIRQLNSSSKNFGNAEKEEARLHGRLNQADYAAGLNILKFIQDKVASGGGSGSPEEKKYLEFIGRDWAGFFGNLEKYNNAVESGAADKTKLKLQIDAMKESKDSDKNLIRSLEAMLAGTADATKLTGMQYLEQMMGQLGLNAEDYKDLLKLIKRELGPVEGVNKDRVITFFTRTLGKEAELFGQQKNGGGISEDDITSTNNTATYRLAELFGFTDVITRSQTAVVRMKLKGSNEEEDVEGTLIEEAPGQEMLYLADYARKNGKKLHFSSEAMRQLNRLQLFDTMCNQIDRHWRNFKCETEPPLTGDPAQQIEGDTIVIKSLKAYDHDMSFGEDADLSEKNYEKEIDGVKQTGKNRFLPPILRKLPMNGALYAYFCENVSMAENNEIFEEIQSPVPSFKPAGVNEDGSDDYSLTYGKKYLSTCGHLSKKIVPGGKDAFPTIVSAKDQLTIKEKPGTAIEAGSEDNTIQLRKYNGVWIDKDGASYEVVQTRVRYSEQDKNTGKLRFYYKVENRAKALRRNRLEVFGKNDNLMALSMLQVDESIVNWDSNTQAQMYSARRGMLNALSSAKFKPGQVEGLNDKEVEEVRKKDCNAMKNLMEEMTLLIKAEDGNDFKDLSALSDKDKVDVMAALIQMRNITDKYELDDNTNERELIDLGWTDYFYKHLQYMIKKQVYDNSNGKELAAKAVEKVEKIKKEREMGIEGEEQEEGKKKKKAEKVQVRYAEVPTILHADKDAYDSLLLARDQFEGMALCVLKDLGWSQKKIQALRDRIDQEIKKLEKAKDLAEKYLAKKYPEGNVLRNFFLKKEEFSSLKSIKDITWDKSMSYYGSEIQNTLVYDTNFTKRLTANEIEKLKNDNKAYYEGEERIRIFGYDGDLVDDEVKSA